LEIRTTINNRVYRYEEKVCEEEGCSEKYYVCNPSPVKRTNFLCEYHLFRKRRLNWKKAKKLLNDHKRY
jgi:hypothetical protein